MATITYILIILSFYHMIYESVLASGLRRNLRYKFFEVRDKLRRLKIELGDKMDEKLFISLDNSINSKIHCLVQYNFTFLYKVNRIIKENPELNKRVNEHMQQIENCPINEVKSIYRRTAMLVTQAFFINIGGWFIYVFPIVLSLAIIFLLVLLVYKGINDLIFLPCKNIFKRLAVFSEEAYFPHYVPSHHKMSLHENVA